MDDPSKYIAICICLVISGFFKAIENSYRNSSRIRFKQHDTINEESIKDLEDIIDESDREFLTLSVVVNTFRVIAVVLFVDVSMKYFTSYYLLISTLLMIFLISTITDMIPKKLTKFNNEIMHKKTKKLLKMVDKLLFPIIYIMDRFTDFISMAMGVKKDFKTPIITQEQLMAMVDASGKEGLLEDKESDMIQNIFELKELQVEDVMTQRMDIEAVEISMTYDEIIDKFKDKKYSRLIVYEDTIDNVRGFLYIKDMFYQRMERNNFDIEKVIRPPYYTYEFVKTAELFESMKEDNSHIAVVLDEYSGVAGLITMEDVLESIVGDIYDEYDIIDNDIVKLTPNSYIINANAKLEDIKDETSLDLTSEDYESLGGFIMEHLGEVPQVNQVLELEDLRLTVLEMNKNRIGRVKVVRKTKREDTLVVTEKLEEKTRKDEKSKEK